MDYSILDSGGKVVGTASSAGEARTKLERGRCVFGDQTIVDENGATISEAQLASLCADEAATENATA
jgi:hypothetical protein